MLYFLLRDDDVVGLYCIYLSWSWDQPKKGWAQLGGILFHTCHLNIINIIVHFIDTITYV